MLFSLFTVAGIVFVFTAVIAFVFTIATFTHSKKCITHGIAFVFTAGLKLGVVTTSDSLDTTPVDMQARFVAEILYFWVWE